MYNNPYFNNYNPQATVDRINSQIAELERQKSQIPQPPMQPITQNFQIAPNNNSVIRYANNIDEVQKDFVIGDTPYFSKDMSVLWVKNTKGEIKSYEINEIKQKDEKDMLIDALMMQIDDLKKEKDSNEQSSDKYVNEPIKDKKSSNGKSNSRINK